MRRWTLSVGRAALACVWLVTLSARAHATERLCDASFEDCRAPLITLIRTETAGIDVAFWFMQDARYQTEIIRRWQAGVPVRVLVDPKANPTYTGNEAVLNALAAAGIPMRMRKDNAPGILHWKMMLFAGQNTVEFGGANYSPTAFVPEDPYRNYEDETPFFSDDPVVVNSFKTKYDDLWLDTTYYQNYANITNPLARVFPIYTKDPELNFPQQEDYAQRLLKRYPKETQKIDVIMYRITDERETDAVIAAMQRGIPVRLISDTFEYRDPGRQWVSYNMDKLWAAGVPLRVRAHAGLNHQKLVMFYSQALSVFGSSNWTTPSANQQQEHNYFTTKSWIFQWFIDHFERKWNNTNPVGAVETQPFTPLPPDKPVAVSPADGAVGTPLSVALTWDGGLWAHVYDVYFGTDPNPPLFAANVRLGPTDPDEPVFQKALLPLLQHGTTYYWRVISKTMAGVSAKGPTVSFTTGGNPPPPPTYGPGANTIVMWTATDVAPGAIVGNWQLMNDATAAGGRAIWNPDRGQSKVSPPAATPANYFETTFTATAGVPYHLWVRLRAQGNSTSNNSVSVQFDDAVDQYGSQLYRIGTTTGAEIVLQDPSGTLDNWGWEDNTLTSPPTFIYFPFTGPHTLRVQQRSDGAIVDQIILSPDAFLSNRPGGTKGDTTIYGSTLDGAPPPDPGSSPPPPPPQVPAPWTQQDIGAVGMPGYAEFDDAAATFTVIGAGADVWGTADALHYVYQPLSGDASIVARVDAVSNTDPWVKAGVMIRESLQPGAAQGFMLVSYSKGLAFQRRRVAGGTSVSTTGATGSSAVAPYWVRLDRAGSTITAYQSKDGVTWKLVGSDTFTMPADVYVGIGVSGHHTDAIGTAAISQVSVTSAPSCTFNVAPTSQSFGSDVAAATIAVGTTDACSWTAVSHDSWLTVTSGASGTGNGSVAIAIAANPGAARAGTLTIGGQTVTINQSAAPACSVALSPTSQAVISDGAGISIGVTADASCAWTAASQNAWLTVAGGASGSGNGSVSVAVSVNGGGARTGSVAIGGQLFTVFQDAAPPPPPGSWSHQDIGAVGEPGDAVVDEATATQTVTGAGADVWGTADALHFSYRSLVGDGRIVARVTSVQNTNAWVKAGVMIRETLDAGSAQAFMLVSFSKGLAFQRREAANGASVSTTGAMAAAPYWVMLDRIGNTFTAYQSADGQLWTLVDTDTIAMGASVSVGLGVSSHTTTATATATFDNVSIVAGTPAPPPSFLPPWVRQDIGAVGVSGSGGFDAATDAFTVKGSGADVWGTADAFDYVYRPMTGDGWIVARVASVQNTSSWAKAGVMIRESVDAGSAHAFMLVSFSKGLAFQRRTIAGGDSASTAGAVVAAPYWVKLERIGSTFNAYQSADGAAWTLVGSDTIAMGSTVTVGLAVSSHTTATATAKFDHVSGSW